jgi:hypothetical protein
MVGCVCVQGVEDWKEQYSYRTTKKYSDLIIINKIKRKESH